MSKEKPWEALSLYYVWTGKMASLILSYDSRLKTGRKKKTKRCREYAKKIMDCNIIKNLISPIIIIIFLFQNNNNNICKGS